jgi:hypothetical protein
VQAKKVLRERLKFLEDELNRHLAGEYGIPLPSSKGKGGKGEGDVYSDWLKSHQPFHWFIEFYGIMKNGGFDVLIGNPPYVVNTPDKVPYRIKEALFTTFSCKNLYSFVCERSVQLGHKNSSVGQIVQLTALCSEKMPPLQDLLLQRGLLFAPSFPRRPESIFDGVEMPVVILISLPRAIGLLTSPIGRLYTQERPQALNVVKFAKHNVRLHGHRIGKLGSCLEVEISRKVDDTSPTLMSLTASSSDDFLYYQETCRYWARACKGYPFFKRNGARMAPPHGRTIPFRTTDACAFAMCLVNSSLFYWYYSGFSDCEHINDGLIRTIKIPKSWDTEDWDENEKKLSQSLRVYAQRKKINTKEGHEIEYDELDADAFLSQ